MPTGPAARIADNVVHPLPPVLSPGPGSTTVFIGYLPAWRGMPLAAVAGLQAAKTAADTAIKTAVAATAAAAGTPGLPAAKLAEETAKTTALSTMSSTISAASGGADIHACTTPLPIPPHGPGLVIDGSPTVLINNLPACRMGDTILEAIGPPNKIAMGEPTVIIGNSGSGGFVSAANAALDQINANNGTVNCGHIIDSVISYVRGEGITTASTSRDGSWAEINQRLGTNIDPSQATTFEAIYQDLENRGPGSMTLVSTGGGSHVVVAANINGQVGIMEGQDWSNGDRGFITDRSVAESRYGNQTVASSPIPDE
jgi:uncharacterized Zn-binding protein involved in type VI secretion